MKGRHLLCIGQVIIFMMMVACTGKENEQIPSGTPIGLMSEIISETRAGNQNLQSTQIVEGRQLGITIQGAQSEHQNAVWLAGREGVLVNIGDEICWDTNDVTVTAYHPYQSEWKDNSAVFTIQTDQTTEKGYLDSDLLWSKTTASPTDNPLTLKFTHKLAKINITLTSEDYTDMSDAVIFISGVRISAGFNRETGELAEATGHVTELKAGVTTDENRTVSALIIPQTIPADTRLVKIQFHGKEFHYTLPEMMEYKGGHSYKYSLKVTDQSLSVIETGSGNINDMENKVW